MAEWNPLANTEQITVPLESSKDENGVPRASIVLAPWSGRERLAYEDTLTTRMLAVDEKGEDTVKIGTYRLLAAALTIKGASGFPNRPDGSPMFTAQPGRLLASSVEEDLLALDGRTYAEVRAAALKVQPLPSSDDDADDEKGDDEEPADGDPSPTPSTSQTPTAGVEDV